MAPDHHHLHHYLDRFVGWKAGLPVYLAMVAIPIVIGFSAPDMAFEGLAFGLLLYLAVWRVTRTPGAKDAELQAIESKP